jgi:hypothetical protein
MESVDDQLRLARSQADISADGGELNQRAVERILRITCGKDSFEVLEDHTRSLESGVWWRRRRAAWTDSASGDDRGLCVNEVRVDSTSTCAVRPSVAMAAPGLHDFEAIEYAYWATYWAGGALRQEDKRRESRLFLNTRELTCARSGAPRGPFEDLFEVQRRVKSGQDVSDKLDLIPTLNPTLRPVEGTPLQVVRYLPAFPPSWDVVGHEHVLMATNGGYFLNFPEEYEDFLSALHQPVGALVANGRLHMPSWIERPCAIEWTDGRRRIGRLGPENLRLKVAGYDAIKLVRGTTDPAAAATVWRSFDPGLPPAEAGGLVVDLVFSGAGLACVVEPGEWRPPIGGAIVRLMGTLAAPWRAWMRATSGTPFPEWELSLHTSREVPLEWVMASGPTLVHDGRPLAEAEMFSTLAAGEFYPSGPPPTRFPYDGSKTRAPRTAIGITSREDWVIVVVDGRADMGHSVGASLEELARLMAEIGCYFALNLDGGGSSVMAIEGISRADQLKPDIGGTLVNIPSDPGHRERIVPVALTVVRPTG